MKKISTYLEKDVYLQNTDSLFKEEKLRESSAIAFFFNEKSEVDTKEFKDLLRKILVKNPTLIFLHGGRNIDNLFDILLQEQSLIDIRIPHMMTYVSKEESYSSGIENFFWSSFPSEDREIDSYAILNFGINNLSELIENFDER